MGPIVTEVEDIDKLLSRLQTRELQDAVVENRLFGFPLSICDSDVSAIAKLEFMEMRPVPPGKCIVNCNCEVSK